MRWIFPDELFVYPEVYFAAADKTERIVEERIGNAGPLVLYVADGADAEEQIGRIVEDGGESVEAALVFEEKYCGVYYFP